MKKGPSGVNFIYKKAKKKFKIHACKSTTLLRVLSFQIKARNQQFAPRICQTQKLSIQHLLMEKKIGVIQD